MKTHTISSLGEKRNGTPAQRLARGRCLYPLAMLVALSSVHVFGQDAVPGKAQEAFALSIEATSEVLGNFSGGRRQTAIAESLLIAGSEVDLETAIGARGLRLGLSGLYAAGDSLTNKAVGDFGRLSNIDTNDSVRLYEAWLEQSFANQRISFRAGQILADAEFFVSKYSALFINSDFGAIPIVSQNLAPPIFPVAAPGARLRINPAPSVYGQIAVFSGDVGDPGTENRHNTRFSFPSNDGVLLFAEVGYSLNPDDSESSPQIDGRSGAPPLRGSYKLGGSYDSARVESEQGLAAHDNNFSLYILADQQLWHPEGSRARALSVFARFGLAPSDRNVVTYCLEAGVTFQGILPGRPEDVAGLGFSRTQLSHNLRDVNGVKLSHDHEALVELTYRAELGEHFSLQPDLQCIFDPGAVTTAETAVIAGLRCIVHF